MEVSHPKGKTYVFVDNFSNMTVKNHSSNADFAEYMQAIETQIPQMKPGLFFNYETLLY